MSGGLGSAKTLRFSRFSSTDATCLGYGRPIRGQESRLQLISFKWMKGISGGKGLLVILSVPLLFWRLPIKNVLDPPFAQGRFGISVVKCDVLFRMVKFCIYQQSVFRGCPQGSAS